MKRFFWLSAIILVYASSASAGGDGFQAAHISVKSSSLLGIQGYVRSGAVYDFDIAMSGNAAKIKNWRKDACFSKAPKEQWPNKRYAQTIYASPPKGYEKGSVIGWVIAVNSGFGDGSVLLKSLRVYGTDPQGNRHLITDKLICGTCTNPDDVVWGYHMPRSDWRDPGKWNLPSNGTAFDLLENGVVKIPTSENPEDLYHLWNTQWPRASVTLGWVYEVEAEVLPQGAGMIQIGMDFWNRPDGGSNVEAAISNWQCATSDWVVLSAGGR